VSGGWNWDGVMFCKGREAVAMRSCWKQQWGMYLACTHLPFRNCFGGKSIVVCR
jgi:hypothetical protein